MLLFSRDDCISPVASHFLAYEFNHPGTHKMEAYLSAAITYLMVLRLEVSFFSTLKEITNYMISHGISCMSGSEKTKMIKSWQ
jgi:hypothetical protein